MEDNFEEEYTTLMKDFQLEGAINKDTGQGGIRDAILMENTSMGGTTDVNNGGGNPTGGAHQPLPGSFEDNEVIPAGGGPSNMGTGIKDEADMKTPIIHVGAPHKSGRLLKRSMKALKNEQAHFALLIATHYAFVLIIGGISTIHTPNTYTEAMKTPFIRQ